jgi:hypothetical protein|tara:strand:- start:2740 stop:3387 length:648 start_codon:yes stop_codon:yes gene_type:complete
MSSETSSPGSPTTDTDPMLDQNLYGDFASERVGVSKGNLSFNESLYGDFAGSTGLTQRMNTTITGNELVDQLIPGVGALSLMNKYSASQLQQRLQRGESPVYGDGAVKGTLGKGLFGGTVYSGENQFNPFGDPTAGGDGSDNRSSGRPGSAVKTRGVSNTVSNSTRVTPNSAVRGAPSLAPKLYAKSRGKSSGVNTSSQGLLGSAPIKRKTLLGN